MKLYESGETNAVCFLTETVSSTQLQYLSNLMDTRKCDSLELM